MGVHMCVCDGCVMCDGCACVMGVGVSRCRCCSLLPSPGSCDPLPVAAAAVALPHQRCLPGLSQGGAQPLPQIRRHQAQR